jgi:hypothetical protein
MLFLLTIVNNMNYLKKILYLIASLFALVISFGTVNYFYPKNVPTINKQSSAEQFLDADLIPSSTTVYEDCILEKMPGVANDAAAMAILRLCKAKYPRSEDSFLQVRDGWFDYSSGAECTAKKGKDTQSRFAGNLIATSCNKLYKSVNPFDRFDGMK